MDWHEAFNYALGAMSAVLAWFAKQLHSDLQNVKKDFAALSLKMVGEYVHKDQLRDLSDALFRKLDRIEDKLDQKADKHDGH